MKAIVLVMLFAFFAGSCFSQDALPGLHYWQLQRQIGQSFQSKDYEAALRLLNEADKAVPNNPRVIFWTAIAEASLHHDQASILHLKRLVEMSVYFDLSEEPAFKEMKKLSGFSALTRAMERIRTNKYFRATVAFRISDPAFFPEGIAYDSRAGEYFVSSVRKRKIVRVNSRNVVTDFIAPRQDGIWGVSGIGVDAQRRLLWACSTAFESNEGYKPADKNTAALFAFNIDTGKLAAKYSLEKPGPDHFCDGLVVAPDGTVFVADSSGLIIYRLAAGARELDVLMTPEAGISPQGLALSGRATTLFASDYLSGLYAIDLHSNRISRVVSRAQQSLAGIDGLMTYGKDLIAIQNGIQPNRVVRLKMSYDGTTVDSIQPLEVNHPLFGEPTLGLVKGHELLFVANNPITQFLKDHAMGDFPDPVILRRNLRSR